VLKIDVEGAEVLIINDLIDNAKISLVRQMIIEYHPARTKQSVGSFVTLLEGQNFLCSHEKDTIHPGPSK
jgi:hypothetical protein